MVKTRREKLVEWGCRRLDLHEQEMESLLYYLNEERRQTPGAQADPELDEIIHVIEAEREQAKVTRQRLESRVDRAA